MKTKVIPEQRINLYEFDELSSDIQQHVINTLFDINVDYDWWIFTYEDAAQIGFKIQSFDIGRASYCNGELIEDIHLVVDKITNNHGEKCETYKLAQKFRNDWDCLVAKYSNGDGEKVTEENNEKFDIAADELEEMFLKDLQNEYLSILKDEYEYRTSKEQIIETIKCNEFLFTIEGKIESL